MSKLQHITVDVTYEVYQTDNVNVLLVNKFDCKCAASDVIEYLRNKGIDAFMTRTFKEE